MSSPAAGTPLPSPRGATSSPGDLAEKVRSGIRWVSVAQILTQLVWLLANPVLARILGPADYGLYYMASVALGFFGAIASLGLTTAVIQRQDLSEDELQTAFWANVGAGGVVFVLGALSMPLIAWLYSSPRLLWMGLAYSATFLTNSFVIMPLAFLARGMFFGRQVVVNLVTALVTALVSIALALWGYGAWSLLLGSLVAQIPSAILALRLARFRPRWHFRWEELRKVRSFSLYLTGELAANYLLNNIDYLVIGYVLGEIAHGYYTHAFNLTHFPYQQMTPVVTRVMFSAFSLQQDDDEALRKGYLNVTRGLAVLTGPILAFFAVSTEFVVGGYLGEKWLPIVPYVRILAIVGALKCVVTCVGLVINAKGRSDLGFRWNLFALAVMTISVVVGVRYGVVGICWAWVIAFVPLSIGIKGLTHTLIDLKAREYLASILPAFLYVALFLAGLFLAQWGIFTLWEGIDPKLAGFLLLGLAIPFYLVGLRVLCPGFWYGIFPQKAKAEVLPLSRKAL